MSKQLVPLLKPWVTSFSAHIQKNYKNGDEVCVGGRVISLLDIGALLPEDSKHNEGVYVTLDDGVGEIQLAMPHEVYDKFKDQVSFEPGSIILANGRIYNTEFYHVNNPIDKHPEQTTRILCWKFSTLPENKSLEVGCE